MKKYITLAALLSAGAAFANAEQITQTLTFDESGVAMLTQAVDATQNWTVTAILGMNPATLTTLVPFGVNIISATTDADTNLAVTAMPSGENTAYLMGSVGNTGTIDASCDWTPILEAYMPTAFKFEYDSATSSLAFSIAPGISADFLLTPIYETTYTNLTFPSNSFTSFATSVRGTSDWADQGWTAPVVTITGTAIPEPSAFGLLAGLGALALVGTRRRRK